MEEIEDEEEATEPLLEESDFTEFENIILYRDPRRKYHFLQIHS